MGPVAGACATRREGRSGNAAAATRLQNANDFMDEEWLRTPEIVCHPSPQRKGYDDLTGLQEDPKDLARVGLGLAEESDEVFKMCFLRVHIKA
jgi:hypothetical protein